jgi:hypothetical protein
MAVRCGHLARSISRARSHAKAAADDTGATAPITDTGISAGRGRRSREIAVQDT